MEGSGPFCNERGCCQNAVIIKKLGCILSYYVIKTRELIQSKNILSNHLWNTYSVFTVLCTIIFNIIRLIWMLLSKFHKGTVPRDGQKYILTKMEELLKSGYKRIIISAPTGIGKSYVAKAIADSLGTSFVVTSTKQLQNQYLHDFPELRSIKGKSNFECYQLMEKGNIGGRTRALARRYTCDRGQCITKVGNRVTTTCPYKKPEGRSKQCVYYKQKEDGLEFHQTILNYAMYFHLKKFQPEAPGVQRDVVIFDEAHTIENEVVRLIGFDILASYLDDAHLEQSRYDLESVGGVLNLLDHLRVAYGELARKMDESTSPDAIMRARRINTRFESIVNVRKDINENTDNFIVQEPEFDGSSFHKLSVVPLDISNYASSLFDSDIQVFMSATIDKNNFEKTLGIGDCGFIDVPKSPFPLENRRVIFQNISWLNNRSPPEAEESVAQVINSIMSTHQNDRGLILTSSRARCDRLLRRLSPEQARRVQLAHSVNEDHSTIDEVLEAHQYTENGVLLSSSLWQGVDLKGDLSRFQIVEKCPYPYLGDNRISAKNKIDRQWYVYQTIVKLLQGFGRSIRDYGDYATTYVMDSSVQHLLKRNRSMVPAAYHDVLFPDALYARN